MDHDRAQEVKAFDESKAGVKGLLDSGLNKVPRIFIRPADELEADKLSKIDIDVQVPVIDLGGAQVSEERKKIIDGVTKASGEWGFFQVVNHGIPPSVLDGMISGIREFHEQDQDVKKAFYTRDLKKAVRYECNYDLFKSRAANWRDTLHASMLYTDRIDPDELPEVCRDATMEYIKHITNLAHTLFELLSEALGLDRDYLSSIECDKAKRFVFHYYPPCPEPDLTMGATKHTDPSFITLLLQDQLGGLQVMHENHWVNVRPVAGGIVVNIGDILQDAGTSIADVSMERVDYQVAGYFSLYVVLDKKPHGDALPEFGDIFSCGSGCAVVDAIPRNDVCNRFETYGMCSGCWSHALGIL